MSTAAESERVLVWAPTGRDAERAVALFARVGLPAEICRGPSEFLLAMAAGAGCALVAEEALTRAAEADLLAELARQPAWSDFPLIIAASAAAGSKRTAQGQHPFAHLGNVTLLDRPLKSRILVGAVQAALRGRRRQYE